jgi:hypothetical protein
MSDTFTPLVPVEVPVHYDGVVTVRVPQWLQDNHPELAKILARKLAVAQALITLNNIDVPEAAYDEFEEEADGTLDADTAESVWAASFASDVCGSWLDAEQESDWRENLHTGDEVTWNDPDGGICTRRGTILSISYRGDAAHIKMTDGWESDVLLTELS